MRLFKCLVALAVGAGTAAAGTPPATGQDEQDNALGNLTGVCFAVGCDVFRGLLLVDSANSGESMPVRVDENLFGTSAVGSTRELRYEDLEQRRNGDGILRLGDVWARVKLSRNLPVTVVLAKSKGYGVLPGPVVVTSAPREAELIRALVAEAVRLRASPGLVSGMVASLPLNPNPALAGYLTSYLSYGSRFPEQELASNLLLEMVRNSTIPGSQMESVVSRVTVLYSQFSEAGKVSIVQRLVKLGLQPDRNIAQAGYSGLADIGRFEHSIAAMIPATMVEELGNAYRSMVRKGSVPRNRTLEAELGIKLE
jgi:hypothetical protein